jgi:tmRNA-binding protein
MFNHDPDRPKKLLLHAREIKRIDRRVREKGYTLIPLRIYLKHGLVKLELGLCRRQEEYDKRADIKAVTSTAKSGVIQAQRVVIPMRITGGTLVGRIV